MNAHTRTVAVAAALAMAAALCAACLSHQSAAGPRGSASPAGAAAGTPVNMSRAAAGPAPAALRTLTIIGAGDVLLHQSLWVQAASDARAEGRSGYDFRPMLAAARHDVAAADLAICHLETPVGTSGGPFTGYPRFTVPPQIASALRDTGFDTCSTASNHTLDAGVAGVRRTLDVLDAAGLRHAGSYRSAAAADTPDIVDVHGVPVAQLSYTYNFNGLQRPAGQAWIANLINPAAILVEARRARQAGAQIVVVSLHWGTEYDHRPNTDQLRLARQLLAAPDIDLILGCHAHVVQPFERIGGKWVAYGMGNEVARQGEQAGSDRREGVMPRFTFTEVSPGHWRVTSAEAIPTWVNLSPAIRVVDLPAALANPNTPAALRQTFRRAYDQIAGYVTALHAPVRLTPVG